jgi:hypothetical protein
LRSGEARSLVTTAPTKEDIVRSIVIICILFGMFGTAGYVFLHGKKVIAAKREQRIAAIWDSGTFQRSLEWLHLAMASDGKESGLPRSAPAQTAQERDAERARTLAVQHEKKKKKKWMLSFHRRGNTAFLIFTSPCGMSMQYLSCSARVMHPSKGPQSCFYGPSRSSWRLRSSSSSWTQPPAKNG